MKSILCLGVTALVLTLLAGCLRTGGSSTIHYSSADFRYATNVIRHGEIGENVKTLEVDNHHGRVRIIGTDEAAGGWSWTLTVRARDEESAREGVAAANLVTRTDDDLLRLSFLPTDSKGRWQFQSDLEIRVPRLLAVRSENRFGATEISGVDGTVEARGNNGMVELAEITGEVRAETSFAALIARNVGPATLKNRNGGIEVKGARGALDAETSFASLVVDDVRGPVKLRNRNGVVDVSRTGDAQVSTSFGALSVREIAGDATLVNRNSTISGEGITGSVEAETSFATLDVAAAGSSIVCRNRNGNIRVHALSGSLTNLQARTSFARLDVRLPGALKPIVEADVEHGKIESDFPVILNPPGGDPFASAEPGTPRISLQNQNGGIRLTRD